MTRNVWLLMFSPWWHIPLNKKPAFPVDPTGTTTTENGISADALETHIAGVFVRLLMHIEPRLGCQDLVLPMLTQGLFLSMLVFQRISFSCRSSSDSVMMTSASAYRFFQGHPAWNAWEKASTTVMNRKGLRQKLWWTHTLTLNSSLRLQPTCGGLLSLTRHLRGAHSAHSRQLALQCHCGQASRLGHLGFCISFVWQGIKGQCWQLKGR